jgi:hypothetical protein
MDLFYHVSRDIELPRAGRRVALQIGTRACEACGEELEANEPSEGGTYGLSFCAGCRDRLDRSAIQIHFCDGCGVSVPLYAVEEGDALAGDGRILCLRCRSPNRSRRLWLLLIVTAILALLAGATLAVLRMKMLI